MPARVLVLESSSAIRSLLRAILSRMGFTVHDYDAQLNDLTWVAGLHPDLIVVGYISGYFESDIEDLCRLHEHPLLRHVPIILCATTPQHLTTFASFEQLTNIFLLAKPFSYNQLVELVNTVMPPDSGNDTR